MAAKQNTCLVLLSCLLLISCTKKKVSLTEVKLLQHYPSASAIEFIDNKFYIIGDDANNLLVLDNNLAPVDSIQLYNFLEKRIPKSVKPDLESVTVLPDSSLMIIGSGSSAPTRNTAWKFHPSTKQKDSLRLDTFYSRLSLYGIKEINIEGAAYIPGFIVFANRGSKGYPKNQFIFTPNNFWQQQATVEVYTMLAGVNNDSTLFNGISGLAYAAKSDMLVCTVSTEDTRNSMDDGAIGKSYLWIIKNISSKRRWKAINPDMIIDLNGADKRFEGQKIESVCIVNEDAQKLHLVLAADNDNGSSTLFRIAVRKD